MNRLLSEHPRTFAIIATLLVCGVVACVYWPVHAAEFVYDDKSVFLYGGELRSDQWLDIVLHGFQRSEVFYRPLGVALFAIEARVFKIDPAPMHLISLGMHLFNTCSVAMLARLMTARLGYTSAFNLGLLAPVAALFYGLHPVLVEPVVWISSQGDLLVAMFLLLGLIANLRVHGTALRAATVAACFFLAACSKEAAIGFPLLMFVADWVFPHADGIAPTGARNHLKCILQSQWPVYLAVFAAGVGYLALRSWAFDGLFHPSEKSHLNQWQRIQMGCSAYLTYWKLLLWPMTGIGPEHRYSPEQFAGIHLPELLADLGACLLLGAGLYLLWLRKIWGAIIVAVTVTLLPVLHLLPIGFSSGLYHERYAMTGAALLCAYTPAVLASVTVKRMLPVRWTALGAIAATGWLLLAVLNVRITSTLWSTEIGLWQWTLAQNPGWVMAESNLFSAYLDRNDLTDAEPLVRPIIEHGSGCTSCMFNIANFALIKGDTHLASTALQQAHKDMEETPRVPAMHSFLYTLMSGQVAEQSRDFGTAEQAYRDAIAALPLNPGGHARLAFLLARLNRVSEARKEADVALPLYSPAERTEREQQFDRILSDPGAREPESRPAQPVIDR